MNAGLHGFVSLRSVPDLDRGLQASMRCGVSRGEPHERADIPSVSPRLRGWIMLVGMVLALLSLPEVLVFAASVTVLIGLPLRMLARWLERKGRKLERRRPQRTSKKKPYDPFGPG